MRKKKIYEAPMKLSELFFFKETINVAALLGTLRSNDADGNENVKKTNSFD